MRVAFRGALLTIVLTASAMRADTVLTAAGATFPWPIYQKWIASFEEKYPSIQIQYRPIGSSAGIKAFRAGEVDFAATDGPVPDTESGLESRKHRHIPMIVGGVVPIYHIEGESKDLRLTPEILAGIYRGDIKRWNDPAIKAVNHGAGLPNRAIAVIHRSDGSGTSWIWTSYLAKVSPQWRSEVGTGMEVKWPVGTGAVGNEGVTSLVARTPNSIGYVEFIYAVQAHLSYALVRNAAGRFVELSLDSLTAAAASLTSTMTGTDPEGFQVSIIDAPGTHSWPIAALTYFIVPEKFSSPEKADAMSKFLKWALTSGQKESSALGYSALPDAVAQRALALAGGFE